jgi:hypothetical protein
MHTACELLGTLELAKRQCIPPALIDGDLTPVLQAHTVTNDVVCSGAVRVIQVVGTDATKLK